MTEYHGFTYPKARYKKHHKRMCLRGNHLFDEVLSGDGSHCLVCDYCKIVINIASVDKTYYKYAEAKRTRFNNYFPTNVI